MTHHHNDWPMLTAALLIGVIGVAVLAVSLCIQPTPRPGPVPISTALPIPTLEMTLTTVIAGPPSPHVPATYRPTPTAFVAPTVTPYLVLSTSIPSLTPLPTLVPATSTPDVLPLIVPVFGPPPTPEGQHVVSPAQIPRRP